MPVGRKGRIEPAKGDCHERTNRILTSEDKTNSKRSTLAIARVAMIAMTKESVELCTNEIRRRETC